VFSLIKKLGEDPSRTKPAGPRQLAKAVFWSFFGVRKRRDLDRDTVSLTPGQIIVAGILGTVVFVAALISLVYFITRNL
jgi:Protein of unknown function (DUF2970)